MKFQERFEIMQYYLCQISVLLKARLSKIL